MHRRTPRPEPPTPSYPPAPPAAAPAGGGGPAHRGPGLDDRFGALTAAVVSGARRRAVRDGDRQVDTAHLLHSLLELDGEARAAFDGGPRQIARLLGYLAQRAIGYGLRWRGAVENSGAVPVLRTAAGIGWSPAAAGALERALRRPSARGAREVTGPDLLAALAADRGCRAVEVLQRAGVDVEALLARLDAAPAVDA
ncbi:Clp protease N-terminal domain-containing protein [Streptomyces sp. URMC 123]|uniref:Clp protease N-terminal domain-containing protein n=1 Tax=Streptomyces sp. URMC 123 TaxID=3423403 RepID=UPI003F1CAC33